MSKIFRIPWFPNQAYIDFTQLNPEEIGVLIQIINLIYMKQGPIENDPKWISKSFLDFGTRKTKTIINNLLEKDCIQVVDNCENPVDNSNSKQLLTQRMAENTLKNVSNMRETTSKLGRLGVETKRRNKQKQGDIFNSVEASVSDSNSVRDTPLPPKGGTGGKPIKKKGKKRNGKSNLGDQARNLLDKFSDPDINPSNDSLL